jgi:Ca2+-binding EF-hand superfamily protein
VNLNRRELEVVFNFFDNGQSGVIDIDEFARGLRGEMNERRKDMVRQAFAVLDKGGSGTIPIEELARVYDFKHHPGVQAGLMSERKALEEFMQQWDRRDGVVRLEEFEDYYAEMSATIDADDYFELTIRNTLHIASGEGVCANTANRRLLVTDEHGDQVQLLGTSDNHAQHVLSVRG